MIPSKIRAVLLCAVLAACGDQAPKMAKLSQTLPNLLLPPRSSFVSRQGGPDALQITLRSGASAEAVTAYYREVLKTGGWHLVNEAKDHDGATVLFAQQNGPPLWVRINEATDGGGGTMVQLSGAVMTAADSARVRTADTTQPAGTPKPTS